jgi:membrane-bound serine protease (ClpP class)
MQDGFGPAILSGLMVVAILLEMLTPAMGGFTFIAGALGIASTYFAFQQSDSFGYAMTAVNLALFPAALWLGIRLIRKSPMMNETSLNAGVQEAPDAIPLAQLLGKEGKALTPLRPGGTALIGETKVDVITQGKYVDTGSPIKVIYVEGNKVVVEAL